MKEGVGNLTGVIETVVQHFKHSSDVDNKTGVINSVSGLVDWKRTYIDLSRLVLKMKELVMKTVESTDVEDELVKRIESTKKSEIYYNFSLNEMLNIRKGLSLTTFYNYSVFCYTVRVQFSNPKATTHEVVRFAPESASALRRKMREQRRSSLKGPVSSGSHSQSHSRSHSQSLKSTKRMDSLK